MPHVYSGKPWLRQLPSSSEPSRRLLYSAVALADRHRKGLAQPIRDIGHPAASEGQGRLAIWVPVGRVPEADGGQYHTVERDVLETAAQRRFLEMRHQHPNSSTLIVTAVSSRRSPAAGFTVSYNTGPASLQAALLASVKDGVRLDLPTLPAPTTTILSPVLCTPKPVLQEGRVAVHVTGLPLEYLVQGFMQLLLQAAGYGHTGFPGAVVVAEFLHAHELGPSQQQRQPAGNCAAPPWRRHSQLPPQHGGDVRLYTGGLGLV